MRGKRGEIERLTPRDDLKGYREIVREHHIRHMASLHIISMLSFPSTCIFFLWYAFCKSLLKWKIGNSVFWKTLCMVASHKYCVIMSWSKFHSLGVLSFSLECILYWLWKLINSIQLLHVSMWISGRHSTLVFTF